MRPELIRSIVLDVFARVMEHGELADRALHRALRAHKELHSAERRQVATALYAMIRMHHRYDYVIDQALARARRPRLASVATPELDGLRYAAALRTELSESIENAIRMAGLDQSAIPLLEAFGANDSVWPDEPMARLAVEHSLPGWAASRLHAEYGDQAPALAASLNVRAPLTLRANTLKTTAEGLLEKLAAEDIEGRAGSLSPWAVILEGHHNVFSTAAYKAGLFDVQDEGSQLIALATEAAAGEHVLDACCGSGGKTLALAAMMNNKGLVIASDVDARRMEDLRPRAALAGAFNLKPIVVPEGPPGDKALRQWRGRTHAVLVDAPCSGTGAWRRHPDSRWRLKESEIAGYATRQLAILQRYAVCVRPGGRLIYATCSLFAEENERVTEAFAASAAEFVPEPVSHAPGGTLTPSGHLKLLPHVHGTDGFFAAVFRRRSA